MFNIDEFSNITLTQGDDATINVLLVETDGKPYTMASGDVLTFSAKQSLSSQAAITSTSTDNKIILGHASTAGLSGLYIYQIQLTKANGNKYTVVQANLQMIGDVIV